MSISIDEFVQCSNEAVNWPNGMSSDNAGDPRSVSLNAYSALGWLICGRLGQTQKFS
jgi:hypothetical protein